MTEEEVKVRIVLPLLASAGIEPVNLQLETTFTVRLGRNVFTFDGKQRPDASGRLDILVKRDNKNLLIVETKRDDLALTDDDRDQAISYARLLDQIAPYAVVTNGPDLRLYDVITKEPLTATQMRLPDGYAITLPEDLKYDALRIFLRASPGNVRLLCQHQVEDQLAPLLGSAADRNKAFIPDLQVTREELPKALDQFYRERQPLFALVGDSGAGKTCSLCALALSQAAQKKPVFFFKAITLERGIAEALAAEFNWTFADAATSGLQVVKRLHDFNFGSPVTLIVDAIDEWPYATRVANLLWLASHVDPDRVRAVVSCKVETWPSFLMQRGTPTGLDAFVYDPKRAERKESPVASYMESGFKDPEFHAAVDRYRRFFDYGGPIDEATLGEAQRNPALLRVLFDVAGTTKPAHLSLSTAAVLGQYISERIGRMEHPEQARHTVTAVASALFDRNAYWIREDELRPVLGLRAGDRIEPDLFDHGVLLRRGPALASDIGFSLAEVRDFLITDIVRRWPVLDPAAFAATIAALQSDGLHAEVLRSYYRRAPETQKRAIDSDVFEAAQTYLRDYAEILQTHFPQLWRSFPGCGTGAPGFYGEFNVAQRRVHFHGFRRQTPGTPAVILHGVDNFEGDRVAAYSFHAETLHWAGDLTNDAADLHRKVVNNEIIPTLEKLVTAGSLNEDATPDLVLELLVGLVLRGGSSFGSAPILGAVFGAFWDRTARRPRFPVSLDAIRISFHRQELRRQIDAEVVEERRTHPNFFQYTREVLAEIDRRLEEALARGDTPSEHHKFMDVERLKKWLPHALDVLRSSGLDVDPSSLPVRPSPDALGRGATREDWEGYLRDLYFRYFSNYRVLVETNFPTLKNALPLYQRMPMRQYLALDQIRGPNEGAYLTILTCKERSAENELIVARTITPKDPESMIFTVDGVDVEAELRSGLTEPHPMAAGPNPLGDRIYRTPLREMVYGTLRQELKKLYAALRTSCGVAS